MLVSDFDYDLPERLIAQHPVDQRDRSRLLFLDRSTAELADASFDQLPDFLRPGDLLVVNNTRVFRARLLGRRLRTGSEGSTSPGARVEVFLVRQIEPLVWEALVRPGRAMPAGALIEFAAGKLSAVVMERRDEGRRVIRFEASGDISSLIDSIGHTPLPPYIKRDQEDLLDSERYQTVYAKRSGAVAAPTAGLHFTPDLLARLRDRGVEIVEITLHVGYGTFQPVRASRVEDHRVEQENYFIEAEACRQLNSALAEGRRVIAVGTTTTRALESWALGPRAEAAGLETDLFIYPGFHFKVISGLITNFHLPRSSLLMLVSAFAGRENVLRAYRHAVERGYQFYSYGDAMLIL
ncbi:MAG TPA: tRNA preQ1(34) S-adenosylmethionine ribosyltransferase-isomerase QueA [Blastocatellia bacterium]|nr:tRNA preQ1(34) S-adenosylmethionine ribosyltransferase-isomerase QueA [Blastocatellia bacterium]